MSSPIPALLSFLLAMETLLLQATLGWSEGRSVILTMNLLEVSERDTGLSFVSWRPTACVGKVCQVDFSSLFRP